MVELPEGQRGQLYVLDMNGQLVLHQTEVSTEKRLDVSGLPAGIYSVEFLPDRNEDRVVYTKRVVVE